MLVPLVMQTFAPDAGGLGDELQSVPALQFPLPTMFQVAGLVSVHCAEEGPEKSSSTAVIAETKSSKRRVAVMESSISTKSFSHLGGNPGRTIPLRDTRGEVF